MLDNPVLFYHFICLCKSLCLSDIFFPFSPDFFRFLLVHNETILCFFPVRYSVPARCHANLLLKCFCKYDRTFITTGVHNILHRQIGQRQLFFFSGYLEFRQEFFWWQIQILLKDRIQITAVYIQMLCNIRHTDMSAADCSIRYPEPVFPLRFQRNLPTDNSKVLLSLPDKMSSSPVQSGIPVLLIDDTAVRQPDTLSFYHYSKKQDSLKKSYSIYQSQFYQFQRFNISICGFIQVSLCILFRLRSDRNRHTSLL